MSAESKEDLIKIRVKDLTKIYPIYKSQSKRPYAVMCGLLRDGLRRIVGKNKLLAPLLGFLDQRYQRMVKQFHALKGVSFELEKGSCIGIVGANGSGKSTLLQIISGILEASDGSLEVEGRIAALLELGSGFNPEFTGRENVYLNASILGLTKQETDDRFDDVEAFASIGEFIECPVKTYSSGMMLRLALAVQVLVDPDVLIVDEALAVGDAAFQRKCFARLEQLRERGTTILFVSHDMSAVLNLCDRAIFLHKGEVIADGEPKWVTDAYQMLMHVGEDKLDEAVQRIKKASQKSAVADVDTIIGTDKLSEDDSDEIESYYNPELKTETAVYYESNGAQIQNIRILDEEGKLANLLKRREFYCFKYDVAFDLDCKDVKFAMLIKSIMGVQLGGARSHPAYKELDTIEGGKVYEVSFRFQCLLTEGNYVLNAGVEGTVDEKPTYLHRIIDSYLFNVVPEAHLLPTLTVDFLIEPSYKELS